MGSSTSTLGRYPLNEEAENASFETETRSNRGDFIKNASVNSRSPTYIPEQAIAKQWNLLPYKHSSLLPNTLEIPFRDSSGRTISIRFSTVYEDGETNNNFLTKIDDRLTMEYVQALKRSSNDNEEMLVHCQHMGIQMFASRRLLETFPSFGVEFLNLETMDVSHNNISQLFETVENYPKLRRLACGSNKIKKIPSSFAELWHLVWLDLTHNPLTNAGIPDDLFLPSLTGLGLSDCQLTEIPKCLFHMNIAKLGLFQNKIRTIPKDIAKLRNLVKLDLSNNLLTELPDEICHLQNLEWLNLSQNQITCLPEDLGFLINLKELGLGFNRLRRLPNLSSLKKLVILPVYNNELEEVDEWLGGLEDLSKLDLSNNKLMTVPLSIFFLPKLIYINLKRNQINLIKYSHLPEFNSLKNIKFLDVTENKLKYLPWDLFHALREVPSNNLRFDHNEFMEVRSASSLMFDNSLQPSLQQLALNTFLTHSRRPKKLSDDDNLRLHHLPLTCQQVLNERIVCYHCRFRMLPIVTTVSSQKLNVHRVTVSKQFCSYTCFRKDRTMEVVTFRSMAMDLLTLPKYRQPNSREQQMSRDVDHIFEEMARSRASRVSRFGMPSISEGYNIFLREGNSMQ